MYLYISGGLQFHNLILQSLPLIHFSLIPILIIPRLVQSQRILPTLYMPTNSILPMYVAILVFPAQRLHLLLLLAHEWTEGWLGDTAQSIAEGFRDEA